MNHNRIAKRFRNLLTDALGDRADRFIQGLTYSALTAARAWVGGLLPGDKDVALFTRLLAGVHAGCGDFLAARGEVQDYERVSLPSGLVGLRSADGLVILERQDGGEVGHAIDGSAELVDSLVGELAETEVHLRRLARLVATDLAAVYEAGLLPAAGDETG